MPTKHSHRKTSRTQMPRGNKLAAALALALVCVVGTSMLAQVNSRKKSRKASDDFGVMALPASGPSKEYVYAGSKLISTVEPTAVNGNDAQFVSMCVHDAFSEWCAPNGIGGGAFNMAGQSYLVEVRMRNTGTATWDAAHGYKLGSQSAPNNTTWGLSRAELPAGAFVSQNQEVTFIFSATKPSQGSNINFQWQMVQDGGVGYFGEKTKNSIISNGTWLPQNAPNAATFVSQSVPSSMIGGQAYSVSITMNNSGTNTWTNAAGYKLGSQLPQNNAYWGTNRKSLPSSVAPNANVTFSFTVTAPSTPGIYNFQWMMVQDGGVSWFGTLSGASAVSVLPPPPAAPSNLFAFPPAPGATQITMTWSDSSNNEDGFKIEQLNGNAGWVQIATVGPNVTTYTATGLQLDNQYCYRVRAYNGSGNSAYSNQDCRSTSSGGD